jgi:DNA topoisomerase I
VARLRRSNCAGPGIVRRRRGRGFAYFDVDGNRVTDPETLQRINDLVLPPAWQDVWICPLPNGHIQATGTDAAGRKQYRYHDQWRIKRDRAKHDKVLELAELLPETRRRVAEHLDQPGLSRDRVLACSVRLLDLGFFRIGGESYAETNETYGLATIRKEHVSIDGDAVVFEYVAKGSKDRYQSVVDDQVREIVQALKRRRGGGSELLAWKDEQGGWHDVRSSDVNDYIQLLTAGEFTAKDFRTWHATVLMAVALAVSGNARTSPTARKRAVARAYREVADYLGNTPAVARASYVDPRIVDLYLDGKTIAPALDALGADQEYGQMATLGTIEDAVREMLQ